MRIGINGASRVVVGASAAEVAVHAAQAEADGFSSYWVNQQVVPDALTLLATLGHATASIELGTAVVPTWTRHPLVMAAQALTTQDVVGGRLVLGIGLAHREPLEERYRIPFSRPATNMSEYLDVLLPALEDRAVDAHGTAWSATFESMGGPPGVAAPTTMLAAMGPRMLAMAGARTGGTILWLSGPRTVAERIRPALVAAAERAGRTPPRIVASVPVCVTDRPREVRALIDSVLAGYNSLPSYRSVLDHEGAASVSEVSVVGDEDEVRTHLERFAAAGTTDFSALEFTLESDEARRTRALLRELCPASP